MLIDRIQGCFYKDGVMHRRTYADAFFFQCDAGQAEHLGTICLHGPVEEGVLFNIPSFACTDLPAKDSVKLLTPARPALTFCSAHFQKVW